MSIFQSNNSSPISDDIIQANTMIKQKLGCDDVPEFFVVQAEHSKTVFTGSVNLISNALLDGLLPRVLKEMICYAISSARGSAYCTDLHGDFCKKLGVNEYVLSELTIDMDSIEPLRTRLIIKFALKSALTPLELVPEDYSTVRAAGVSDAELMEALAVSASAVYTNIMAESLQINCNK